MTRIQSDQNTMKMSSRDRALIHRLLDSEASGLDISIEHNATTNGFSMAGPSMGNQGSVGGGAMAGLSSSVQIELSAFLEKDSSYELLTDCITNPEQVKVPNDSINVKDDKDEGIELPSEDEGEDKTIKPSSIAIKRSFRAMTLLVNDVASVKAEKAKRSQQQQQQQYRRRSGSIEDNEDLYKDCLLNSSRAGLLAKKIFSSYRAQYRHLELSNSESIVSKPDTSIQPHTPHLNKTLSTILHEFPSSVIGASCAGGLSGIEASLEPMLRLEAYYPYDSLSSPLATMVDAVHLGCTGRRLVSDNELFQQQQQQGMLGSPDSNGNGNHDETFISKGHRRKFVHSLSEWRIFSKLVEAITGINDRDDDNDTENCGRQEKDNSFFYTENSCDAFLKIVEFLVKIPKHQKDDGSHRREIEDSVGEEALLSSLISNEMIQRLSSCACYNDNQATAAARAMVGLFQIATGTWKNSSIPSDIESDIKMETKNSEGDTISNDDMRNNKMINLGLTAAMHLTFVSNIDTIVKALDVYVIDQGNNTSNEVENESKPTHENPVHHPGRYVVKRPFTSRRLHLFTLLADLICYEDNDSSDVHVDSSIEHEKRTCAIEALEALMEFPVPPSIDKGKKKLDAKNSDVVVEKENEDAASVLNPWPGICDFLFEYPENSMFQVQFYRLLHALCMTNHEPTLKLIVQKCKFVTRAIRACKPSSSSSVSNRGVLLRCLNALNLHSQSLPPNSFLRHYLDSHDVWKSFQGDLKTLTYEQQLPGGGSALPDSEGSASFSDISLDLGSSFAAELGFPASIMAYIEVKDNHKEIDSSSIPSSKSSSPSKKKKKRNRKKKK